MSVMSQRECVEGRVPNPGFCSVAQETGEKLESWRGESGQDIPHSGESFLKENLKYCTVLHTRELRKP